MPKLLPKEFVLITLAVCLTFTSCRRTPQPDNRIVIGQTVTVPSRHLNKDMIIDVYLPAGYSEKSDRYPVLVTCQSQFLHVSGITADLAWKNGAPELIVASVRNYSSGDFMPEKIEGHPDSGGADRFIAFFKDELLPGLDSRFRTYPFRIFYSGSPTTFRSTSSPTAGRSSARSITGTPDVLAMKRCGIVFLALWIASLCAGNPGDFFVLSDGGIK
jgi:hypothetical protein